MKFREDKIFRNQAIGGYATMVSLEVFRSGGRMGSSISDSLGRCKLPDSVPAGKRLVIETVTGYYYGDGALLGTTLLNIAGVTYAFPWVQCGGVGSWPEGRSFYGFNHFVHLYVDGPAELQFDAAGGAGGGSYDGGYSISGYLVNHP